MKTPTAPSGSTAVRSSAITPVRVDRSIVGQERLELDARLVRRSDPVRVEVAGAGNQAR
jgi:hypothetical protein